MHLTNSLRAEAHIKILNERLDVALRLLEKKTDLSRDEAESVLEREVDQKVVRVLVVDDEPVARRFDG